MLRALALAPVAALAIAACSSSGENIGVDHSADTVDQGFCRSTTCQLVVPRGYPRSDACEPAGFSDSAECRGTGSSNAPLWWRSSCVGYDLNGAAGRDVSYAELSAAVDGAFAAWTGAACGDAGGPSIAVSDLGAVSCARANYDKEGPNQNVITFHDDAWPYEARDRAETHTDKSTVIALTTVTFDVESGEIYDADVELNSKDYRIVPLSNGVVPDGETFDLATVLTHELGHFFGIAHSPSPDAVMNPRGDSGSAGVRRALRPEDARAVCAVYPPDHRRWVSTLVDGSGYVGAGSCDPTPRHGFRADCP
jgi:hypothetical protein